MWATVIVGLAQAIACAIIPETHPAIRESSRSNPNTKYLLFQGKNKSSLIQETSPRRRIISIGSEASKMIITEPIILFLSIWQSTVFGIVYIYFSAFPIVFGGIYGFNDWQIGLSFLGLLVGLFLFIIFDYYIGIPLWVKTLQKKGQSPEHRVLPAMIYQCCIIVSLFLFACLARPSIHWIGPIIASALYGFGALGVILATFGYLLDTYRSCIPAAGASTSVVRSLITAFCPLFGDVFFRNVGTQNASIILACISVLELGIPLVALLYGHKIRAMSAKAIK